MKRNCKKQIDEIKLCSHTSNAYVSMMLLYIIHLYVTYKQTHLLFYIPITYCVHTGCNSTRLGT